MSRQNLPGRILLGMLLLALPCLAQQSTTPSQNATPAPAAPQQKHTTADDNPFPEEESKKAATEDGSSAAPAPPGTSRPDSPGYSSSRTGIDRLKDDDSNPDARISDGAGGYIHDPDMATKDLKIGNFYLQKQDYKGAYNRFLEATRVDPDNADAVFYLAEAARGMNKKQEAVQNFQLYLAALPDGKRAKEAHRALTELTAQK